MISIRGEIDTILEEANIDIDAGKQYLLCLYLSLSTKLIPEEVIRAVNLTRVCERNYNSEGGIKWNVPLFEAEGQEVDENWKWVDAEYRTAFHELRRDAAGNSGAVLKKMQVYFAKNPHVRKEDVMAALNKYLEEFRSGRQNVRYLQKAQYFISKKDSDGTVNSRLEEYLEIIKNEGSGSGRHLDQVKKW